MHGFEEPLTCFEPPAAATAALERDLHLRADELLGRLHALTRRRDTGEISLQESLPLELSLVVELGQVQDRLSLLGCHVYDGCVACRPRDPAR